MTNGQRGMRQIIQRKRSETEHFRAVLNYCRPQGWSRTKSSVQRQKKPRSVFFEHPGGEYLGRGLARAAVAERHRDLGAQFADASTSRRKFVRGLAGTE